MSIEFKVNLVAPARGNRFRASARVVRAGRTVTVASAEFRVAESAGGEQSAAPPDTTGELVAIMTGTMMTVRDRPGLID